MIQKKILEIDSLFLAFNEKIIFQDAYLKIETGKIVGLIGANSSGKTLLFETIFGTYKKAAINLRYNNKNVSQLYLKNKFINLLPEKNFVPGFLSMKKVFLLYNIKIRYFINIFPEFKNQENRKIKTFSFGEKKLIETFLIIESNTIFSMLDQPFSHIMPKHVDVINCLIKKKTNEKGFLITDYLYDSLIANCDDIYLLRNGNISILKKHHSLADFKFLI